MGMGFLNRDILAAVLTHWLHPMFMDLAKNGLGNIPILQGVENTIRQTGWVGVNCTLADELSPYMGSMTKSLIGPIISQKLSMIPDESIPMVANDIVDDMMEKGEMSILDGKITFCMEDLQRLKNLLHYNLKVESHPKYEVKEEE